jgi:hypothetical protein
VGLKEMAVVAAALAVVGAGAAAGVASADPPAPGPAPGPAPKTTIDHDGTFAVGVDIAPGNYRSPGPVDNSTCDWKRVGSDDKIVDNALTKKPQIIAIDATDKAFKTNGCQTWQLTDQAPPAPVPPAMAVLQLPAMLAPIPKPAG